MKNKTVTGVVILGLSLLFFIPKGNCISDSIYLNPEEERIYRIGALRGEIIQLNSKTYNNPFIVLVYCWALDILRGSIDDWH